MAYSLRFPNDLDLYAGNITLSGVDSNGNMIPPIISPSTELCANIYVQRAVNCDTAANVSSVSPLNITNMAVLDYILKGQSANTAHWVPNTPQPAASLLSDTTTINVSYATAPTSGQVLTATSNVTATWQTPSGGGGSGNITSNAFTITNDPVANYILTGINSTNASWQPQGKVADSIHADWANTANVATTVTNTLDQIFLNPRYFCGVPSPLSGDQGLLTSGNIWGRGTGQFVCQQGFFQRTTNQIVVGNTATANITTFNFAEPAFDRTIQVNDPGSDSYLALSTNTGTSGHVLTSTGTNSANWAPPAVGNLTGPITSVGLATSIAAQTGTGSTFVMQNTPTLTTPVIGAATGTSLDVTGTIQGSQLISDVSTGTAPLSVTSTTLVPNLYVARAALADNSTTIPNLTGPITSVGVATSVAAQTGTGSTFVMQNTPTLTTPVIGAATGTSLDVTGTIQGSQLISDVSTGTAPLTVTSTTLVPNLYVARSALGDVATQVTTTTSASAAIHYFTYAPLSTTSNQGLLVSSSSGFIPSTGQLRTGHYFGYNATQQLWLGGTGARITASSGAAVRDITIPNIGTNSNIPLSTNLGTAGQVLTNVGSGYGSWQNVSGGFTLTATKTANYTAVAGEHVLCSCSVGSFTVTLPASPSNGDLVRISLITESGTNTVSIGRNGSSIDGGTAAEYELYHTLWKDGDTVTFEYLGGTTGWTAINRYIKNRFLCRAYLSANQNFTTSAVVQLNTLDFDYNGNFDNVTNYEYTAPVTGVYQITGTIAFINVAIGELTYAALRLNGTTNLSYNEVGVARTPTNTICTSITYDLAAGDTIDLFGYCNGAASTFWGGVQTNFSISLITRL